MEPDVCDVSSPGSHSGVPAGASTCEAAFHPRPSAASNELPAAAPGGSTPPTVAFSGLNKADIMLAIHECKLGLVGASSSAAPPAGDAASSGAAAASVAAIAGERVAATASTTAAAKAVNASAAEGAEGMHSRVASDLADMHKFLGIHLAAMQLQLSAARDLSLGRVGRSVDEAMTKIDAALTRLCSDLAAALPPPGNSARSSALSVGAASTARGSRHPTALSSAPPDCTYDEAAAAPLRALLPGAVASNSMSDDDMFPQRSPSVSWDPTTLKEAVAEPMSPTSTSARRVHSEDSKRDDRSARSFSVLPVWEAAVRKAQDIRERAASEGAVECRPFMSNHVGVVVPSHGVLDETPVRAARNTETKRQRRTGTKHRQRRPMDAWFLWMEMRLWTLIVNPNSSRRVAWDIGSLFCIMYDLFIIPLQLFDPPANPVVMVFAWATRWFWTLDMVASCFTGYVLPDGSVELHPLKVMCRYFKTWFLLDFVIVAMDWAELLFGSVDGNVAGVVRFGKASRTFRVLRMLRLLRLVRIRQIMQQFTERVQSEQLMISLNLTKLMALITSAAHILSCLWYGIGTQPPEEYALTWVEHQDLEGRTFWYKYTTSLHWAFSQFTGGMEDIVPVNLNERIFAIFALMVAFVGATIFMSALTSWLTQLHILWSKQSRQLALLRRYLMRINVSTSLAMRVQRNAQYVLFERTQNTPEEAVELLDVISEPLRMELHYEMYLPVFLPHPFLGPYMRLCPQVMRKVCHHAAKTIPIACGDVIFHTGESPPEPKMYFLLSGRLHYIPSDGDIVHLEPGDWIAEATLWVDWKHRGLLKAVADGQICTLSAVEFQRIVSTFEHDSEFTPGSYAEEFVNNLNSSPESAIRDVPPKDDGCVDPVKSWFNAAFARRPNHRGAKSVQFSVRFRESDFDDLAATPPAIFVGSSDGLHY